MKIETILIGELLSENGYIVKNGGYRGLMEAVSNGATYNGGKAIGFTCKSFGFTQGNEYLSETVECDDIYDRLRCLNSDSDVFVIQRGGIGTLAEVFLLLDEVRKMKNKPKIYIFGEQWSKLFSNLSDFMSPEQINMIILCDDFDDFSKKFK